MALSKTLELTNGATGTYFKITLIHMRVSDREVSVHFSLYSSAAKRASNVGATLVPVVAKMRLAGDQYDRYLGPTALQDTNHIAQLYKAAKVEEVISDYSKTVEYPNHLFADATDA